MKKIHVIEKPADKTVVELLEGCLERARSGEVLGVVVIQSFNDACTNHCWAGVAPNAVRITGELMIAASCMARNIDDNR